MDGRSGVMGGWRRPCVVQLNSGLQNSAVSVKAGCFTLQPFERFRHWEIVYE